MFGIVDESTATSDERTPLIVRPSFRSIFQTSSADSADQQTPTRHAILIRSPSIESGDETNQDVAGDDTVHTNSLNSSSSEAAVSFKSRFERSLHRQYPAMFIIFHSIISILFSASMIVCERLQPNKFTWDDLDVFSYKTLNGLILWASSTNILYSLLALFTVFKRKYILIQLTSILNLIASIMSFFYFIVFNIVILIFSLMDGSECDYVCILMRSSMIIIGVLINILNISFYLLIQFNFLNNLNRNQFHHHNQSGSSNASSN